MNFKALLMLTVLSWCVHVSLSGDEMMNDIDVDMMGMFENDFDPLGIMLDIFPKFKSKYEKIIFLNYYETPP